jgi:hypothetical protein
MPTMPDSSRDSPQGVSYIDATGGIVNQVGQDQYNNYNNHNNAMNDEMVVRQSYQSINPIIVQFCA